VISTLSSSVCETSKNIEFRATKTNTLNIQGPDWTESKENRLQLAAYLFYDAMVFGLDFYVDPSMPIFLGKSKDGSIVDSVTGYIIVNE